jgi:signal peptidase II
MKKWLWFTVSIVVILVDQLSKYWAITHLNAYQPEKLLPMLNVTLAYNTGAAFSFLNSAGKWHLWFFIGFSLLMSIVLIVWIIRTHHTARLQLFSFSLILGGAIGNFIDRAHFGYVVDFIDVYYKTHHWPVFNIADSAICVGAFLLLIELCKKTSH